MTLASELREMSEDQLAANLREACNALFKLKVQAQTDRLDVPSELRRLRAEIARIKTIQNERKRELEAAKAEAAANAASAANG